MPPRPTPRRLPSPSRGERLEGVTVESDESQVFSSRGDCFPGRREIHNGGDTEGVTANEFLPDGVIFRHGNPSGSSSIEGLQSDMQGLGKSSVRGR